MSHWNNSTKVGGPFVETPPYMIPGSSTGSSRKPILTPPLRRWNETNSPVESNATAYANDSIQSELQFLLAPASDRIQVLSMQNGNIVSELVLSYPQNQNTSTTSAASKSHIHKDSKSIRILSLTITKIARRNERVQESRLYQEEEHEWVILAGCSDGKIAEWSLLDLYKDSPNSNLNPVQRNGRWISSYIPRRCFIIEARAHSQKVSDHKGYTIQPIFGRVTHLTAPNPCGSNLLGYTCAFIRDNSIPTSPWTHFTRIIIPPWEVATGAKQTTLSCKVLAIVLATFIQDAEEARKRRNSSSSFLDKTLVVNEHDKKPEVNSLDEVDQEEDDGHDRGAENTLHKTVVPKSSTHNVQYTTNIRFVQNLPFQILSGFDRMNHHIFTLIIQPRDFTLYCENFGGNSFVHESTAKQYFVHFPRALKFDHDICSAAFSPNGDDIALGFFNGSINIFSSILSRTVIYLNTMNSNDNKVFPSGEMNAIRHPMYGMIIQNLHWHALPVHALCYLGMPGTESATTLVSGGEESVLVMWNMERGLSRPSYTLPRISKGAIAFITSHTFSPSMEVVVNCMDNTIQLIHAYNYTTKWKIQGLATALNEPVRVAAISDRHQLSSTLQSTLSPILLIDPRTQNPILTRLEGAPGVVHWYDLTSGCVVGELEIAPYNRVSRKESSHYAYPRPVVTHLVLSANGQSMISVDVMLTENTNVGAARTVALGKTKAQMSLTTNIKFWGWSKDLESASDRGTTMPYEMISAMPAPHGLTCTLDALAINPGGSKACSFSSSEGAFHVWTKQKSVTNQEPQTSSTTPCLPPWSRLYKISTPSGYANCKNVHNGLGNTVAFSMDGSLLAVAYGKHITLWDHTTATMLHTVAAPGSLVDLQFIKSASDVLLTFGESFVSTVPLFGSGYLGDGIWCYQSDKCTHDTISFELGRIVPMASMGAIVVVLQEKKGIQEGHGVGNSSKVVFIDAYSGEMKKDRSGHPLYWDFPGTIENMCALDSLGNSNPCLLLVNNFNEMFVLNLPRDDTTYNIGNNFLSLDSNAPLRYDSRRERNDAPTLPSTNKRRIAIVSASSDTRPDISSLVHISEGSMSSTFLSTNHLPVLNSSLTIKMLGWNMKKKQGVDSNLPEK